jgi:long-chain acyl-CoA synthetase
MERTWLRHYPAGVPAEIDVHEFASIKDVLQRSCQRFGELPAYSNRGASITYDELDRASRAFAAYLQQSLGLHKGDRVALMMPNLLQYPVALFGVLRAGLVVVNVNPQYTAPELEHQLRDSGALAVVVLENFAHTLQEVLNRNPALQLTVITTEVGDMFSLAKELLTNLMVKYVKKMVPEWKIPGAVEFNAALRAGQALTLDDVPLKHSDRAFLQYTGGTTGAAKGRTATWWQTCSNSLPGSRWVCRTARRCLSVPCRCTTSTR